MKRLAKKVLEKIGLLKPLQSYRDANRKSKFLANLRKLADSNSCELTFNPSHIAIRKDKREIRIDTKHVVYVADMINFFEYYHGAVYPKEIDGILMVDYSHPALHRLSRSGIEFEFPSLPESDESTEIYVSALNLKQGDVVLDLGAYAGASAYFIAQAVGSNGIVVSFEPDEINYEYLSKNINRHLLQNVIPIQCGIWNETTTLSFQAEGNMGSSIVNVLGRTDNMKSVKVLSLEDAAKLTNGRNITAIKMDIEGAELAVLKGAGDFLRKNSTRCLVIEPHVVNGVMVTEEISKLLQSYGYETRLVNQGAQNWPLVIASLI